MRLIFSDVAAHLIIFILAASLSSTFNLRNSNCHDFLLYLGTTARHNSSPPWTQVHATVKTNPRPNHLHHAILYHRNAPRNLRVSVNHIHCATIAMFISSNHSLLHCNHKTYELRNTSPYLLCVSSMQATTNNASCTFIFLTPQWKFVRTKNPMAENLWWPRASWRHLEHHDTTTIFFTPTSRLAKTTK